MQIWMLAFAAVTSISATGFVVVAVLWLRRLRETVASALAESANQQIRTAQRLHEALDQVHKQQQTYEDQLQLLSQANAQLRQGLLTMATRLEVGRSDSLISSQTIH